MTVLAVTDSQALWYLTRGTGLVSIILLTLSVALGIAQVQRWLGPSRQRFVITQLHRNTSLLVVVFLGLHIATSILDGFAPIHLVDAVVPFGSPYRPLWLGLGALSFDLLVALVVTSLLRERIGYRTWRALHWTAYLCWPIAMVHGLGTGSDGRVGWVQAVYLSCLFVTAASVVWRLARDWEREPALRIAGAVASGFAVVVIFFWAYTGPARAGWARKAGTPESLLSPTTTDVAAPDPATAHPDNAASAPVASGAFDQPFQADLTGTISQTGTQVGASGSVTIDATLSSGVDGSLRIVIQGRVASGGGLRMDTSTVTMGPPGQPDRYSGTIDQLDGTDLSARLTGPNGTDLTAVVQLQIPRGGDTVTGTVTTDPGAAGPAIGGGDHD